jgi:hypothetical protein
MSIVQILTLIRQLGPLAKAVIQFAIEHKAEFQALIAALRDLFSGGQLMAAVDDDTATECDVKLAAVECGCTEDEAAKFIDACG